MRYAIRSSDLVLIQTVKKSGDDLIVNLQAAGTSCENQVNQLVTTSKVAPGRIQAQLARGKAQIQGSITPFIVQVQKEEDHFAKLAVITPDDVDRALAEIQLIRMTALGTPQVAGVVTVTCQTVVLEIKVTIEVIVIKTIHHEDDD